jgi:hypothetical protein
MTVQVFIGEYPYVSGHDEIDYVVDEIEGRKTPVLHSHCSHGCLRVLDELHHSSLFGIFLLMGTVTG